MKSMTVVDVEAERKALEAERKAKFWEVYGELKDEEARGIGMKPYHYEGLSSIGWEQYRDWLKVNDMWKDLQEEYETNRFAHCKWKYRGFVGFVDDFGSFRYMPGST